MTEFRFNNDHNATQAGRVIDLLRRPRLWIPTQKDYPLHEEWLQKVEGQILDGTKRAMVAYKGARAVGAVVYQRDQSDPGVLEVRNITVDPELNGRYVGSFLLRNSEIEAVLCDFPGVNKVVIDTKQTNREMIKFLTDHGYGLQRITDLYGSGTELDAVFTKTLA